MKRKQRCVEKKQKHTYTRPWISSNFKVGFRVMSLKTIENVLENLDFVKYPILVRFWSNFVLFWMSFSEIYSLFIPGEGCDLMDIFKAFKILFVSLIGMLLKMSLKIKENYPWMPLNFEFDFEWPPCNATMCLTCIS